MNDETTVEEVKEGAEVQEQAPPEEVSGTEPVEDDVCTEPVSASVVKEAEPDVSFFAADTGEVVLPPILDLPPLPTMPDESPAIVEVPMDARISMLKRGGKLHDIRVCPKCYTIKTYPNQDVARRRRRNEPFESGVNRNYKVCHCDVKGSVGPRSPHRGRRFFEKVAEQEHNAVVFALFY